LSYFESRLPVKIEDIKNVQNRLEFCEKLGIRNVILEYNGNSKIIPLNFKKKIEKELHINLFYRSNLRTDDFDEFKTRLKKFNKVSDIISVESVNKDVQLYAAKDSRVDIVSFSDKKIIKSISPGVISLTKQNNSFIEFSLAPIMESNKVLQSKNFRNLYRFINLARKLKANYIISGNFVNLFDLRHPRALISVCHTLLGIPFDSLKKAFITNPKIMVRKARERKFEEVETGVKIIKEGVENR